MEDHDGDCVLIVDSEKVRTRTYYSILYNDEIGDMYVLSQIIWFCLTLVLLELDVKHCSILKFLDLQKTQVSGKH